MSEHNARVLEEDRAERIDAAERSRRRSTAPIRTVAGPPFATPSATPSSSVSSTHASGGAPRRGPAGAVLSRESSGSSFSQYGANRLARRSVEPLGERRSPARHGAKQGALDRLTERMLDAVFGSGPGTPTVLAPPRSFRRARDEAFVRV